MAIHVAPLAFQAGGSIFSTGSDFAFKVTASDSPSIVFYNSANAEQLRIGNDWFNNLFIGKNAGSQNDYGGTTIGAYNTFVGAECGVGNNTGYALTAGGFSAMAKNTSGSRSTAYGYQALFWNTTGSDLTALGTDAGFGNTTASRSIYIGYHCGKTPTGQITGSRNILIGAEIGQSAAGITDSVIIGDLAGFDVVNDYHIVAVGKSAGQNLVNSGKCVFLGSETGRDSTTVFDCLYAGFRAGWKGTASFNTLLGSLAGQEKTAGNNCIGVGYQALYESNGSQVTAVGNRAGLKSNHGGVFLGYRAGETETGSNKLYIHNNESDIPLIYGDFVTKVVKLSGYLQFNEVALGTALNESVFVDTTDKDIKFKDTNGVVSSLTGRVNLATEGLTATGNWTQNWNNNRLVFENISNLNIGEATNIYGFELISNSTVRKMIWKNTTTNRSTGINAANGQNASFGVFNGSAFESGVRAFYNGAEYRTNLQLTNSNAAVDGMSVTFTNDAGNDYVKYSIPKPIKHTQLTGDFNISPTDYNLIHLSAIAFPCTATLPPLSVVEDNKTYTIRCIDTTAGACQVVGSGTDAVEWAAGAMTDRQVMEIYADVPNSIWRLKSNNTI